MNGQISGQMSGPYFLEVLGRGGEVRTRQRLESLPATIGRGYRSDVILDDPHTAPNHAEIILAEDGRPVLRDLGSLNGILHRGVRTSALPLDGDTQFRLGHTTMRLRPAGHTVEPELHDTASHGWEGLPPALVGGMLLALLTVLKLLLTDTTAFEPVRYLLAAAYALGGGILWAGLWSVGNRLFAGHSRFGRHLFIAGCGVLALHTWGLAAIVLGYAFSLDVLYRFGSHAQAALALGVVAFHLRTIKPGPTRRFVVWWGMAALVASGLSLLGNYQGGGRFADHLYMPHLLPPVLRMTGNQPVEYFIKDSGRLKAEVDAERAKRLDPGAGEGDE